MKLQISQIVHFQRAAEKLRDFVDAFIEKAPPDKRPELMPIKSAADTVERLAMQFNEAELNVK